MSALPGQTLKSYEETLRKVLALKPEHISAYSLIVEEGTLFYEWFGSDGEKDEQTGEENSRQKIEEDERSLEGGLAEVKSKKIPDEIIDRQMYELTKKLLEEQGYYRYEISNYALKGYECKHNIGYWKRKEYLGLGLGAASLVSNVRYRNISDLKSYLEVGKQPYENAESFQICQKQKEESSQVWQEKRKECIKNDSINRKWTEEQTKLSITDQREEFMFLGLRMMEGVSPKEFEEQFGQSIQEVYGTSLEKLERQGLLKFNEEIGKYALTLQGIDVSNQVFVEFLE